MAARWQGVIALLLLIIISYVDRVNISVMILNPEFAAHFQLNENRMLQGMLMTCFLLGYGFSALLLTPVIESRWHYRQGLLISIVIWALVCAISPLLGSLEGMLIARIVLGGNRPWRIVGASGRLPTGHLADGARWLDRLLLCAGADESPARRRVNLAVSPRAKSDCTAREAWL